MEVIGFLRGDFEASADLEKSFTAAVLLLILIFAAVGGQCDPQCRSTSRKSVFKAKYSSGRNQNTGSAAKERRKDICGSVRGRKKSLGFFTQPDTYEHIRHVY